MPSYVRPGIRKCAKNRALSMLIPSSTDVMGNYATSLSRRVNANSQQARPGLRSDGKLIKKGEC